jgi:hypothetical protein
MSGYSGITYKYQQAHLQSLQQVMYERECLGVLRDTSHGTLHYPVLTVKSSNLSI